MVVKPRLVMPEGFLLYLLLSEKVARNTVDIENIEPTTATDHHNDRLAHIEEISHSHRTDEAQA